MNTTSILGCALRGTVGLAALVVAVAVVGRGAVAIAQPASPFTWGPFRAPPAPAPAAVAGRGAVATAQPASPFTWGPCPETPAPIPALATARCGQLTVPEN